MCQTLDYCQLPVAFFSHCEQVVLCTITPPKNQIDISKETHPQANLFIYFLAYIKMSTNPPEMQGLCTFTEQILDGKPQNLQNFMSEICFLYDPVCYTLLFQHQIISFAPHDS